MSILVDHSPTSRSRRLLATVLLLAMPLAVSAQHAEPATPHHLHGTSPAASSNTDPHAMHGAKPPAPDQAADHAHRHHAPPDAKPVMDHAAMSGMDHSMHGKAAMPAMDHASMHGMDHTHGAATTSAMPLPHAQGDTAMGERRSPDYSDGVSHGDMPGMHMIDNRPLALLRVDQLEATRGRHANGQAWSVQGWYGNDRNKLWMRSEGERSRGRFDGGEVELLWSHAVAPFWDTQLGVRQDMGRGPQRHWAAFGIQGLAPYWFELEATAYVGPAGRTAARLHAEYELLFTQRLILQPEFEVNLHGRNDAATRTGRGLSDTTWGLRLRYEIRRKFAPYIGVAWTHRYGTTADYVRQDGEPATDRQFVAGVRFWF